MQATVWERERCRSPTKALFARSKQTTGEQSCAPGTGVEDGDGDGHTLRFGFPLADACVPVHNQERVVGSSGCET